MKAPTNRRALLWPRLSFVLALACVAAGILVPEHRYQDPPRPTTTYSAGGSTSTAGTGSGYTQAAKINAEAAVYTADKNAITARRQALRAGFLAIAAGILTALGLFIRWRTHESAEDRDRVTRRDVRFAGAIEQLAHEKASVRMGGIYTLEALAKEDPRGIGESVVQILTQHTLDARRERGAARMRAVESKQPHSRFGRSCWAERLNAVLQRRPTRDKSPEASNAYDELWTACATAAGVRTPPTHLDLWGAALEDAALDHTSLAWAEFSWGNLRKAGFAGADMRRIGLVGADLTDAELSGADLTQARAAGANLTNAEAIGANLTKMDLRGANLTGAKLANANLTGANLANAILTNAELAGADLSEADLTGATYTEATFEQARSWGSHPSHQPR